MIEEPLYNGPILKPAAAPQAIVPEPVGMKAMQRGREEAARNAENIMNGLRNKNDFTRQMEDERIMMEAKREVIAEADRRLNLPDGDEESFFDGGGRFRQVAYDNFISPYKKQFTGVGNGIVDEERRAKMQFKALADYGELEVNLLLKGLQIGRQKAIKNLEGSLSIATQTGDFLRARDSVAEARATGVINDNQADLFELGVQQKETEWNINQSRLNGTLWTDYKNNALGYMSPEQELAVQRTIDADNARMLQSTRQLKRGKNGELQEEKVAPAGLSPACLNYWTRLNDPTAQPMSPQERYEGVAAFTAQVRGVIGDTGVSPELIEAYAEVGKEEFGIPREYTQKIAQEKIAELKGAKPDSFKGFFDKLQHGTPFLTPNGVQQLRDAEYQYEQAYKEWQSTFYTDGVPKYSEENLDDKEMVKKRESAAERLGILKHRKETLYKKAKDNEERLLSLCSVEMSQWEADHPNATAPEVAGKRVELIERYRNTLGLQMMTREAKEEVDKYMIDPQEKQLEDRTSDARKAAAQQERDIAATDAARGLAKAYQKETVDAFNVDTAPTAASSLPETDERIIVYVPKGQARNKGEIVVAMGGQAVRAELRETEAVSEAVFSDKLRALLGMNGTLCRKPFSVSINNGRAVVAQGRLNWKEQKELSLIATPENDSGPRLEWINTETAEPVASTGGLPPVPEETTVNDTLLK